MILQRKKILSILLLLVSLLMSGGDCRRTHQSRDQVEGIHQSERNISQVKKHALIVAVSDYQGKFMPIHTEKDVELIDGALKRQNFNEADIHILQRSDATKAVIINEIEKLATKMNSGDIIFIHFSCHGQQIPDDSGDEIDGLDESLLPYDAEPFLEGGTYNGELHLRDDEIGELLNKLREKAGSTGTVLLSVDACYSGTISRGPDETSVRGIVSPVEPKFYETDKSGIIEQDNFNIGNLIVLSASSCHQVDHEIRDDDGYPVGPLSYSLSKALRNESLNKNMTYRGLFDIIKNEMGIKLPLQTPQIEGNVDNLLFSGEVVVQTPYYEVYGIEGDKVIINGGNLNGLFNDSEVQFHKIGAAQPNEESFVAEGKVTSSNYFTSEVTLKTPAQEDVKQCWVFVTKQTFGDYKVKLKTVNLDESLKESISKIMLAEIVNTNPDYRLESRDEKVFIIDAKSEFYLDTLSDNNSVIESIKDYTRINFMKKLELDDRNINLEVEIKPRNATNITSGGNIILKEGDKFDVTIKNTGNTPFYYVVLDLLPKGGIKSIIPTGRYMLSPDQRRLQPEDPPFTFSATVSEPFGLESIQVFATNKPVNFDPIVTTRGEGAKGDLSPLELLFSDIMSTRGVVPELEESSGKSVLKTIITIEK